MTDNAQPNTSYVDDYAPPAGGSSSPTQAMNPVPTDPITPPPADTTPAPAWNPPATDAAADTAITPPPASTPTAAPATADEVSSSISEALEDQNIFQLLGVNDATDEEKEAFLDELQQVIWEDFLENDVQLLLTEQEMTQLREMMAQRDGSDLEQQEEIVVFLEKIVPDLEDIMLEKALELKSDMMKERIAGMREYFQGQTEVLAKLDEAESKMAENQWRAAADVLNSLQ